jgi:hypothetical protein
MSDDNKEKKSAYHGLSWYETVCFSYRDEKTRVLAERAPGVLSGGFEGQKAMFETC